MALAGVVAGAIGFFAGGFIGAASCDWTVQEAGCLKPMVSGAIIGDSILMPFGVQLANWRQGSVLIFLSMLVAVGGIAVSGLAATFATGLGGVIFALPFIQLISCVAIQWAFRPR